MFLRFVRSVHVALQAAAPSGGCAAIDVRERLSPLRRGLQGVAVIQSFSQSSSHPCPRRIHSCDLVTRTWGEWINRQSWSVTIVSFTGMAPATLPLQPSQTQPPAQCSADRSCDGGPHQQAIQQAPAHGRESVLAQGVESRPRTAWPEDQRSDLIVEPVQRQVGEWVADPGPRRREQVVSPHHTGQSDPQKRLQSKDREAAAENAGRQSSGPLTRGSLLLPKPLQALLQAVSCLLQHPAHGSRLRFSQGVGGV